MANFCQREYLMIDNLLVVECQDRVYKFKNRYLIYAVHERKESQKICFVFSGVDATAATCRTSYFGLGKTISEATVVHIMDNYGAHGCYLLNIAGDAQIRNGVIELIRFLQKEYGCTNEETYLIGTSKGATIAIAYALFIGGGHVICGEPQIMLGDFIYNRYWENLEQWRSLAYAITGRVNPNDKDFLNTLLHNIIIQYGSRFKGQISIHYGATGYWEHHISYFLEWAKQNDFSERLELVNHNFEHHEEVVPVFYREIANVLTKPLKIAIIGSCVTRDCFKYIENVEILYVARTSLISLISQPANISEDQILIEGNFERKMVFWDLNKEFLKKLTDFQPDSILLDFIDERFDIIKYDGGYYTRSNYLVNSGVLDRMIGYQIIRRQAVGDLWMEACREIGYVLCSLTDNIILHKTHWATCYRNTESDDIVDFDTNTAHIAHINNNILNSYYDTIQMVIPDLKVIDYNPALLYSDFAHEWGKDYFHFGDQYYRDISEKITSIFDELRM
jgi:hypothetical protein